MNGSQWSFSMGQGQSLSQIHRKAQVENIEWKTKEAPSDFEFDLKTPQYLLVNISVQSVNIWKSTHKFSRTINYLNYLLDSQIITLNPNRELSTAIEIFRPEVLEYTKIWS